MRVFTLVVATFVLGAHGGSAWGEDLGLAASEGFTVTKYADDSLAHDIYSMTIDTAGRVVVSGPGYIKILVDADRDGVAERAVNFAAGPASGAQGMVFLGRDLLCTGDAGLIRYQDDDKDDRADGPPQTFMKIRTGGEHNAHAVRRGPDGRWYLLAGNTSQIDEHYVTLKSSPIRFPHGGAILRLAADLSGAEVFADGFRNAYDFDFNAQGDLFVYDSDGEKDVSLPWYRPTRLFHVLRGGEHGWITDQWKRPDFYLDSPPVVCETGRGSPTGVVCYRHTQFPSSYRNGMFLLDWTFGRIYFLPLQRAGATWTGSPQVFLSAIGQFGFAPTDAEVGIDGSLYVCVGGRGTQGTVYRISYTGPEKTESIPALISVKPQSPPEQRLAACLSAPMPHSAWSRARWLPLARSLGEEAFRAVAIDEARPVEHRIRSIEILTEVFQGVTSPTLVAIAQSKSPDVRARAIWSMGQKPDSSLAASAIQPYLSDADPAVKCSAVDALWASGLRVDAVLPSLAQAMNDPDRVVRLMCSRMVPTLENNAFKALSDATRQMSWRAAVTNGIGYIWRVAATTDGFNLYGLELGRRLLEGDHPPELQRDAVRILQASLADTGPDGRSPSAFDGYGSPISLKKYQADLKPLGAAIARAFPTGNAPMDQELSRLAAMIELNEAAFKDKVLSRLTADSHPVDDLHYLAVLAKTLFQPSSEQRQRVAAALVLLDQKLHDRNMPQDTNWKDRVSELYGGLVDHDAELPAAILAQSEFGRPAHVLFLSQLPEAQLPQAVARFSKAAANPEYAWTNDVVFVIGFDKSPEHLALVREQYDRHDLRLAVLMVLAARPAEEDRTRYAEGLDSAPVEVVTVCLDALEKLPARSEPEELAWLVRLIRRLGADPSEYPLRERAVKLLERNSKAKFPFVFGEDGHRPQPEPVARWTAWLTHRHPSVAEKVLGSPEVSLPELKTRLAKIDWKKGDVERGRKLFVTKSCATCHSGSGGIGPDLAGITGRFSREDLFVSVAAPNQDVSPRYQTTLIQTRDGKQFTGMLVYENVDGLVIRNSSNQTHRLDLNQIEARRSLTTSLMPAGLMKDMTDSDLADMYRYLQSLNTQTADASSLPKQ